MDEHPDTPGVPGGGPRVPGPPGHRSSRLGPFEWFGFGDVHARRRRWELLPEHRGQGLGTTAQRLLVDHLFRFTTVHRLEAGTDAHNLAEQKALERIGFTREGVLRQVAFRDGAWRDTVMYGLLRQDWQQD